MDTYSLFREFADSWVLLAMFTFFIGAALWAFRPGGSRVYDEVARIPLRQDPPEPNGRPCPGQCEDCRCARTLPALKGKTDV